MTTQPAWTNAAIIVARLLFAGIFAMGVAFKVTAIDMTAGEIAGIGLPFAQLLAWLAAFVELGLVLALLTGAFFREAALLAAAYVLFLAFAFHGPAHWTANPMEFGFFADHFTFIAGLLFAAAYGPGPLALKRLTLLGRDMQPA